MPPRHEFRLPRRLRDARHRSLGLAVLLVGLVACSATEPDQPPTGRSTPRPSEAVTLASYFPPSEAAGGWRTGTRAYETRALGIDSTRAAALAAYVMSVPNEKFWTGVSGYDATNKAVLIVKGGWIAGEYYNQATAVTAVYNLASNSKTFSIMLVGRMQLDYPGLGIGLASKFYDSRWLANGYPLSDPLKSAITLDQVFRHTSGIIPEAEGEYGAGLPSLDNWSFVPYTVGQQPEYPQSAPLYYPPGDPAAYPNGSTYSSVAFNHFSLIFRNVTGLLPGAYLRRGIMDPIGVGRVAYRKQKGIGDYDWITAGNALTGARDFARLGYLLLHEGAWQGQRIFTVSWIRQFTKHSGYHNIRSNQGCYWGGAYPTDMYLTAGAGINRLVIVPSLDLVATINGRFKTSLNAQVTQAYLAKLFAAVTEPYVGCDGVTRNGTPAIAGLTLINSDTDRPLGALTDGTTLDLAALPTRHLNVRADPAGAVASVRFGLDAKSSYRLENSAPFALAGDTDGDYVSWTPATGSHTISATPYSGTSGSGIAGARLTLSFSVK